MQGQSTAVKLRPKLWSYRKITTKNPRQATFCSVSHEYTYQEELFVQVGLGKTRTIFNLLLFLVAGLSMNASISQNKIWGHTVHNEQLKLVTK